MVQDKTPLRSRVSHALQVARDRLAYLGIQVKVPRLRSVMRMRYDFSTLYKQVFVVAEPATKSLEDRLVRWSARLERWSTKLALYRQKTDFASNGFRQTDGFGVSSRVQRGPEAAPQRPRAKAAKAAQPGQTVTTPTRVHVPHARQARPSTQLRDQSVGAAVSKGAKVAAVRPRRVPEARRTRSRQEGGEMLAEKSKKNKS